VPPPLWLDRLISQRLGVQWRSRPFPHVVARRARDRWVRDDPLSTTASFVPRRHLHLARV